ncbi:MULTISPECIES: GntR family transcriptional regulator [Actinomycetes]|uniref:GntR family transcriptional regulator n=1 Tax=Streptomyces noursei TaxID=1971 RepID=A0A2N8P452_STRNR|nr:GntR family transcriptional regulator [Streptomyces noursei]PNE35787.1 GntR family transcriptional regulator [Streptomyces noursei]
MPEKSGYAEIAAHFRQKIRDGELRPGDAMPSMTKVGKDWGVAQTTVNRAFRALKMEGLTIPKAGVGTVVAGPTSSNIEARVRLHEATGKALGSDETSRILEIATVGADELIAPRLDVAPGTPVHVRRRVVSRNGAPIHLSSSFYPAYVIAAAPELAAPTSTGGSRELAAERLGVAQDHVLEEVTSRLATKTEKAALGLTAENVVVTQVIRTVYLTDGRVVEVAVKIAGGSTILRWSTSLSR